MAIKINCDDPRLLLDQMVSAVKVGIEEWQFEQAGFTPTDPKWTCRAFFRPKIANGRLLFHLLGYPPEFVPRGAYAGFNARFVDMLLRHFHTQFSRIEITALPKGGDTNRPVRQPPSYPVQ